MCGLAHALDGVEILESIETRHRLGGHHGDVACQFTALGRDFILMQSYDGNAKNQRCAQGAGDESAPAPTEKMPSRTALFFELNGLQYAGGKIRGDRGVRQAGKQPA